MAGTEPVKSPPHRHYAVFISYRHADNREPGRQWATWLHHSLETYEVPADLIGAANERGEPIPSGLFPVFRDEEELPAGADLSSNIREALKNSGLLVVLCSPRAAKSRFVADEVRYFKELGRGDRVLALMIDGEPNASEDPAKARDGMSPDWECFPEPLRFGVQKADGGVDWSARAEPVAADVRPGGRPEMGFTNAPAYREALEARGNGLSKAELDRLTTEFEKRLEQAKLKIVAGSLGIPLGELTRRDKAYQLAAAQKRAATLRKWLGLVAVLLLLAIGGGIVSVLQKERAVAAHLATRQALARADFQEASQLLYERHETSRALACLGSSLETAPLGTAAQQLYGLLLHRSWLIQTESAAYSNVVVSPALDRLAFWEKSGPNSRIIISNLFAAAAATNAIIPPAANIRFTDDGGTMVAIDDAPNGVQTVSLWNAQDGKSAGKFAVPPDTLYWFLSPSGRRAVMESGTHTVRVVDTRSGAELGRSPLDPGYRWRQPPEKFPAAFDRAETAIGLVERREPPGGIPGSPSADLTVPAAGAEPARIRCFRLEGWEKLLEIEEPQRVEGLAFAGTGDWLVYSTPADSTGNYWMVGQPLDKQQSGWRQPLDAMPTTTAVSPDGLNLAVVSYPSTLSVFDVYLGGYRRYQLSLADRFQRLAFSHDGRRLAVITREPAVRVINLRDGGDAVEPRLLGDRCIGVAFSRDDRALRIHNFRTLDSYDIQISPLAAQHLTAKSGFPLHGVAIDPQGRGFALITSGGVEGGAVEFLTASGAPAGGPVVFSELVRGAAFSPDGKLLAVAVGSRLPQATNGALLFLNTEKWPSSETSAWAQIVFSNAIPHVADEVNFSADGRWAMLRGDFSSKQLDFFDMSGRKCVPTFARQAENIDAAAMSRDGSLAATVGNSRKLRLWSPATGKLIGEYTLSGRNFFAFPDTIDISSDGSKIVIGSRALIGNGAVHLFSTNGMPLWPEPVAFESGVTQVRFGEQDQAVAVSFIGENRVVLLDVKTGRPRTGPMQQPFAVTGMEFVQRDGLSALCVACGEERSDYWLNGMGQPAPIEAGAIEYWDPLSGCRIGDRVDLSGAAKGVKIMADGRLVSWCLGEAVLSENPLTVMAASAEPAEQETLAALCGAMGGWRLNEWHAPEAGPLVISSVKQGLGAAPTGSVWSAAVNWLAAPPEQRALSPDSATTLREKLAALAQSSPADNERALDIDPHFAPALSEYWMSAASAAAKDCFLAPARDKSIGEKRQREAEWDQERREEGAGPVFRYAKARHLADFLTLEAIEKCPDSGDVWRARGIFLRLSGQPVESESALSKALAIDPKDKAGRNQLALVLREQDKNPEALKQLNLLCEEISRGTNAALGEITSIGFNRLELDTQLYGSTNIPADARWLQQEIDRALKPSSLLSYGEVRELADLANELADLVMHFEGGPPVLEEINFNFMALVQEKRNPGWGDDHADCFQALWIDSLLLQGKRSQALAAANKCLAENRQSILLQASDAHALILAGHPSEARVLYGAVLETDKEEYQGQLLPGILEDLVNFRRHGVDAPGLSELQESLQTNLPSNFGMTVTAVLPEGKGAELGIKKGDRILTYDGEPVLSVRDFTYQRRSEAFRGGQQSHTLVIWRGDQRIEISPPPGRLGIDFSK